MPRCGAFCGGGCSARIPLLTRPAASPVNGYTLGLAFAMGLLAFLFWFGKYVLAPYTLKGMELEEYKRRTRKFGSNVLGKALLVLYIVYPGVSVAIFGACSARRRGS